MAAIQARGLIKRYAATARKGEEARPVVALAGVDLEVQEGEMFALLGPNGAGKTTLFSILATLLAPSEGTAQVLGHDVMSERETIRRQIGIVFQEPALDEN